MSKENLDMTNEADRSTQMPEAIEKKLSKRQLKKLAKKQKWLEQKAARRAKEKEKRKTKIQQAHKEGRVLGPTRKQLKQAKMKNSLCKVQVVIDMSYEQFMTEAELTKSIKQLHRCYSINRRAKNPLQLYVTSFSECTKDIMTASANCLNWDVHLKEATYTDVFDKENIVFLTSESPNVLDFLDDSKAYIIGGLVDHNRHKGLCYKLAIEKGIDHARLPIEKYLVMKTRKILTIDQVFLILLKKTEGHNWKEAFLSVLPQRKGAIPKEDSDDIQETNMNSELIQKTESNQRNSVSSSACLDVSDELSRNYIDEQCNISCLSKSDCGSDNKSET